MMKTFGKRSDTVAPAQMRPAAPSEGGAKPSAAPLKSSASQSADRTGFAGLRAEAAALAAKQREEIRVSLFKDLLTAVKPGDLAKMEPTRAREELADVTRALLQNSASNLEVIEQETIVTEIVNDMLGLGPLESLLSRDDIADIMVCGPYKIFIEVNGKLQLTDVKFRDEAQLINICQRIVSGVGRQINDSSPICDARLPDGSRVAIVTKPLALDGTCLTIRKFKKEKLSLEKLVEYGTISKAGARILEIASQCRCNILVSGGTGSGKTTLLNCLTRYIDIDEAIITCEDAAELQLQQPNVRRWETRPPNLEGAGEINMSTLVKASLRHRPERIIIGEVRGKEAFDLLQAMNTGHDGSAGTVHSNSPKEAVGRLESLIALGGYSLAPKTVREQIASSIDVVVQASRLRDGSRKITHITEIIGMEGDVVTLQDLMTFEQTGDGPGGKIIGRHKTTGMRPHFFEKARSFGLDRDLMTAMQDGG